MLIFVTDESIGGKNNDFSIYGGLILGEQSFRNLTTFIYDLKKRYVYPQHLELKWTFRDVFENMKRVGYVGKNVTRSTDPNLYNSLKSDYDRLKEEILDEISKSKSKIVVAIRPNQLLKTNLARNTEYSIGAVARKFEKVLAINNKFGVILADELIPRVNNTETIDYQYIIELCCNGSYNVSFNKMISIIPTVNSHASPVHQINDILLGAIQFYILEFIRGSTNSNLAKNLLNKIVGNFYRSTGGKYVINNGILLYPPKNNRLNTAAGRFLNKLEAQMKLDFGIM